MYTEEQKVHHLLLPLFPPQVHPLLPGFPITLLDAQKSTLLQQKVNLQQNIV